MLQLAGDTYDKWLLTVQWTLLAPDITLRLPCSSWVLTKMEIVPGCGTACSRKMDVFCDILSVNVTMQTFIIDGSANHER